MDIPNVSSWRLNKAENDELKKRVETGEVEKDVKREIQRRKATACEQRKKAAAAIASKPESSAEKTNKRKKSANASAAASLPAVAAKSDPTNASYYAEVEADLQTILAEFPGLENESPLPLSSTETDKTLSGIQEPYNVEKGRHTLEMHHVYRCSIALWSLNLLGSATPGIPMSRRRVLEMASFYFPAGKPAYMTGRMVEVYVDRNSLGDRPKGLQMISPEEIVHSLIAAAAEAIRLLVCMYMYMGPHCVTFVFL